MPKSSQGENCERDALLDRLALRKGARDLSDAQSIGGNGQSAHDDSAVIEPEAAERSVCAHPFDEVTGQRGIEIDAAQRVQWREVGERLENEVTVVRDGEIGMGVEHALQQRRCAEGIEGARGITIADENMLEEGRILCWLLGGKWTYAQMTIRAVRSTKVNMSSGDAGGKKQLW